MQRQQTIPGHDRALDSLCIIRFKLKRATGGLENHPRGSKIPQADAAFDIGIKAPRGNVAERECSRTENTDFAHLAGNMGKTADTGLSRAIVRAMTDE